MATFPTMSSPLGAYMSLSELSEELTFQKAILESIEEEPPEARDQDAVLAATEIIKDLEAQMRKLKDKMNSGRNQSPSRSKNPLGASSANVMNSNSRRRWDSWDLDDPFADLPGSNHNIRSSSSTPHSSTPGDRSLSNRPQLNIPTRQRPTGEDPTMDEMSGPPHQSNSLTISRSPTPSSDSGEDDIFRELERAQRAAEMKAKRERDDEEYARKLQEEFSAASASSTSTNVSSGSSNSVSSDSIAWSAPNSVGFTAFDRLLGRHQRPSAPASSSNPNMAGERNTNAQSDRPMFKAEPGLESRHSMPGSYLDDSDSDLEIISRSDFRANGRHNNSYSSIHMPGFQQHNNSSLHHSHHASSAEHGGFGPSSSALMGSGYNPASTTMAQFRPNNYPMYTDEQLRAHSHAQSLSRLPGLPGVPGMSNIASSLSRGFGDFLNAVRDPVSHIIERTSGYDYGYMLDIHGNPLDARTAMAVEDYVNDPRKTKEEIQELLKNIRPDMEIPKENREGTPEGLKYPLYEHQKLALTWMKSMEEGTNKGGILADDMGLGKTISALALILSRPSTTKTRKTTLIVGPVALVRQWERETRVKITNSHRLSTFLAHGKKASWDRLREYDIVFTTYGTLAAEYKRLVEFEEKVKANPEFAKSNTSLSLPFLGPKSKWYRVILDEAQCIKNKNTKAALACCHLQSLTRFCLTGTPMMNGVHELYSLIHFLRIKPYNEYRRFTETFNCLTKGSHSDAARETAMRRLQAVIKAILLRRTKESEIDGKPILTLPPKTEEHVHAVFNEEELSFYGSLENNVRVTFNKYLRANTIGKNYSNILVLLLRLRQAACHPHLIMDFDEAPSEASADEMLTLAKTLTPDVIGRILQATVPFECPVCYDVVPNPRIVVPCGHDTCAECMVKISENLTQGIADGEDTATAKCPACRGPVDIKKIIDYETFKKVHMPGAAGEAEAEEDNEETESDDDGESLLSDDDSDSEDDDSDSDLPDIRDFVVPDNHFSDDEGGDETSGEEYDDDPNLLPKAKNETVKEEGDVKNESDNEDIIVKPRRTHKRKASQLEDDDEDYTPEDPSPTESSSSAKALGGKKTRVTAKKEKKSKKSKKSKKDKKGKGKATEDDENEFKGMTLSKLKLEASKSHEGRRRYKRYLRKHWETSAKTEKCLEILRDSAPDVKTIVFSQFTTMLDLIEVPLRNENIKFERYDGSMSADARHAAIERFTDDPRIKVMLVSLKAGNSGLNLVAASQVIIFDPFWNPFIEMQAVDRAHRIGQQKPVTVHRILVEKTVEDRIIELQEKKRKLVNAALDEKASQGMGRLTRSELIYLFNGDNSGSSR